MLKIMGIVLTMSFFVILFFSFTSASAGSLDGKIFSGEMGEKGKMKGDRDQLEFKNGKFHSFACDAYGFTPAPYSESEKGGTSTFQSETSSLTEGEMSWSGTVQGEILEGTVVWKKKGQPEKEYWIKAKLQK